MKKITYTKNQLMKFTVAELEQLPLYSLVNPKGLNKKDLVSKMFDAQTIEETPDVDMPNTTPTTVVEKSKKVLDENKAKKSVVFHRGIPRKRNPMSFR